MRTAFIRTLTAIAKEDPSVMLLTGDLGFTVLEEFRDQLPKQYLNCGVAEQNMIGVAAGLAMTGRRVFVYSIIPFVTFRCFEHIRDDACYHELPVYVTGVGSGYSYGHMGSTHHALEDIAVLRSLPNMTVVSPGDPAETEAVVRAIATHNGPCYSRLGKAGEPRVHQDLSEYRLGQILPLREGSDVLLLVTGNILPIALQAADALRTDGLSIDVRSVPTVKPLDVQALREAVSGKRVVATIEEHSAIGGLGSAVAETLADLPGKPPHLFFSAPDGFAPCVGSQNYLRERAGLTAQNITERIRSALRA